MEDLLEQRNLNYSYGVISILGFKEILSPILLKEDVFIDISVRPFPKKKYSNQVSSFIKNNHGGSSTVQFNWKDIPVDKPLSYIHDLLVGQLNSQLGEKHLLSKYIALYACVNGNYVVLDSMNVSLKKLMNQQRGNKKMLGIKHKNQKRSNAKLKRKNTLTMSFFYSVLYFIEVFWTNQN